MIGRGVFGVGEMLTTTLVRHKVKSYDQWAPVFFGMTPTRARFGCKEEHVYRGAEDPNFVVVRLIWGSPEQARAYFASPDLMSAMQKAGVAEAPTIDVVEESR